MSNLLKIKFYIISSCILTFSQIHSAKVLAYQVPSINDDSGVGPLDPHTVGPDFSDVGQTVITFLLAAAGVIAIIVVIWSGVNYITAGGDSTKAEKAKKMLIYAILGIIIITASLWLKTLVIESAKIDTSQPTLHGLF